MSYLNLTVIFEGSNLNYGEGFGNVLSLKKISSKTRNYSYISRQAIRYDIVRMMNENFDINLTKVNKAKGVIQFDNKAKIDEYPEIDLFGYMKTEKKGNSESEDEKSGKTKIRKAVVRLSDAVSLEPFNNDMEFATNKGLADRIQEDNDIYQAEIHKSFYSYTITVELDKIGVDENEEKIKINNKEKAKRVNMLLDIIKLLYRDIRGKRENLSPVFVIGGIYETGNPFFYNRIHLNFTKDKILINSAELNDVLNIKTFDNKPLKEQTNIGVINGIFSNIDEIDVKNKQTINDFFETLKKNVETYYQNQK